MLYTIRQYGLQLLAESGEDTRLRSRHLDYFLGLVERGSRAWLGPKQVEVAERTRREHNNLRAALEFGLGAPEWRLVAARLATTMHYYWLNCGFSGECRRWLDRVLELDDLPLVVRHDALWINSYAATGLGELRRGQRFAEAAADLSQGADDPLMTANALFAMSVSTFVRGELELGESYYQRCIESYAKAGVVDCQTIRSYAAWAMAAAFGGSPDRAVALAEKAIEIATAHGEQWAKSYAHYAVALAAWQMGRPVEAAQNAITSIKVKAQFRDLTGLAVLCELLAWIAGSAGSAQQAAETLGVAGQLWRQIGSDLINASANWNRPHRQCEDGARSALGDDRFQFFRDRAAALGADVDDAVNHMTKVALSLTKAHEHIPTTLTRREMEVAELAASGASNKDIAARLTISARTAEKHLANILKKLGLASRAQLAAWVADRGVKSRSADPATSAD
jgi:non-specific serine/threonine protein kinase